MIWNLLNEVKTEQTQEKFETSNLILYLKKWEKKVDGAKPKVSRRKERSEEIKWNRNKKQ